MKLRGIPGGKTKALTPLGQGKINGLAGRGNEIAIEIGARDGADGNGYVYVKMGPHLYAMTPERAEEIAVQLRQFAIEVRNGGRLA